MRFAFTEDQALFRASLKELLERNCPADNVRAAWRGGEPAELWAQLAELGVVGMTLSEQAGGLGMTALDWVLLLEEAGYAALPEPLAQTTACAAPLFERLAPAALASQWLPRVQQGDAKLGVCFESEPYLAHAARFDLLLIQRGAALYAAPPSDCELSAQRSLDHSRGLARVGYQPKPSQLIAQDAREALAQAYNRAVLAQAAELIGLGRRMLDMTVDYVKLRHQFGKPIGSYQAVKHRLADSLLKLEFARPLVHRAAYSCAHPAPLSTAEVDAHVSMATLYARGAADFMAKSALQLHGAIGYTFEFDLQLWLKRSWALQRCFGSAAWHRERVAKLALSAQNTAPQIEAQPRAELPH